MRPVPDASETETYGGVCPVCGRKITIGVFHRVEELADRPEDFVKPGGAAFESLVPPSGGHRRVTGTFRGQPEGAKRV